MKKVAVALVLALLMVFCLSGVALADDPTETTASWDGSGWFGISVDSGDSYAGFDTAGSYVTGTYMARDNNDNPYNYQVDSFSTLLTAHVEDGYVDTGCMRINSKTSMYGDGGQLSYLFVAVEEGEADVAYRSTTNYAQMRDCTYTYQLPGGHNVVLDAAFYEIDRYIEDGRGDSGEFYAVGTGDATLDCMNAEASGGWDLKLGRGCGCYTDANFNANGAGYVEVTGIGNNSVSFPGMGISTGGGVLQLIANWVGSISIGDYSLIAN
jgi:hypothetical protein